MEVQPWIEYGPVRVAQMVFQFARSVASQGGNEIPGNAADGDPVVTAVARFCSAAGNEVISWDSCVAMSSWPTCWRPGLPRPIARPPPTGSWFGVAR